MSKVLSFTESLETAKIPSVWKTLESGRQFETDGGTTSGDVCSIKMDGELVFFHPFTRDGFNRGDYYIERKLLPLAVAKKVKHGLMMVYSHAHVPVIIGFFDPYRDMLWIPRHWFE